MTSRFCCTAPSSRSGVESPVPPYRTPDFTNLSNPLFALASLPEDHPHALTPFRHARKSLGERARDFDILRSPTLGDKVRLKLGNGKSRMSLKSSKGKGHVREEEQEQEAWFDEDAHVLSTPEVLDGVGCSKGDGNGAGIRLVEEERVMVPARGSSKRIGLFDCDHDLTDLAFRVAARRPLTESDGSSLPRAASSPMLLGDLQPLPYREPMRRTKSYGLIGQALTTSGATELKQRAATIPFLATATPRMRSRGKSNTSLSIGTVLSKAIDDVMNPGPSTAVSSVRGESSGARPDSTASVIRHDTPMRHCFSSEETITGEAPASPPPAGLERSDSTHLDLEAIRNGTRCISRVSTALSSETNQEDVSEFLQSHRWNHNRSITPEIVSTRHRRQPSSRVGPPTTILERLEGAREDVYSPSIYSRRGSAEETRPEIPMRMDSALRAEWPLKNDEQVEAKQAREMSPPTSPVLSIKSLQKPLPPTPESGHSPSTFKSPPKKAVKKRRSIFRFLRPGSRKGAGKAIRSISSPVLLYRTPVRSSGGFDGPADEITVQYELAENPQHRRSMTVSHLAVPQDRSGTLVEYERSLSVGGDSRRRGSSQVSPLPSSINESARTRELVEISEDEELQRAQSSGRLRRKLSRAHALDEAGKTLMGAALKKHQQEKALFRSESKRKESMVSQQQQQPTSFRGTNWGKGSLPHMVVTEEEEEEGPPDGGVPGLGPVMETRKPSTTTASTPRSPRTEVQSPATPKRIGTSLPSWSRFPSHTRDERCGSAGRNDAISTRDWASPPDPNASSPLSKHSTMQNTKRVASSLIKSPSRTFSRIARYYSDLFTRDVQFHGGNRRTSVSASTGHVLHPELEMLPSGTGSEGHRHDHSYLREVEARLFGSGEIASPGHGEKGEAKEETIEHDTCGFRLVSAEGAGFRQGSIFAPSSSSHHHHAEVQSEDGDEIAPEAEAEAEDEQGPGLGPGPMDGADEFARMYQESCLDGGGREGEGEGRAQGKVRKYPSVTVMDDCKGHRASISLVANCA
ncbi:Hypothetical predicted protein [Lecanosticta acicola]|uniref:Uncharacterized protein n=1 Tax=Lecanosticta acicola TaxID=111012 RepID=A0AAI8Z9B3_9PEZI|nr:Hypothetical predicted protein [Lecanosticta acicola]